MKNAFVISNLLSDSGEPSAEKISMRLATTLSFRKMRSSCAMSLVIDSKLASELITWENEVGISMLPSVMWKQSVNRSMKFCANLVSARTPDPGLHPKLKVKFVIFCCSTPP